MVKWVENLVQALFVRGCTQKRPYFPPVFPFKTIPLQPRNKTIGLCDEIH